MVVIVHLVPSNNLQRLPFERSKVTSFNSNATYFLFIYFFISDVFERLSKKDIVYHNYSARAISIEVT